MAVFQEDQEGLLPLLVEADLLSFTIFQKGYVAILHIHRIIDHDQFIRIWCRF